MINPMQLEGRRVLITGASSGIGRETAVLFSQLGAQMVLVGRDEMRLQQTLTSLEGAGHRAEPFDLTRIEEIPQWMKRITGETGALDALVHSAGVHAAIPVHLLSAGKIEEILRVNVRSSIMLAKAFRQKSCRREKSSMVFLSSVSGLAGAPAISVYAASKAALLGMVRSLAVELAQEGVRVNCVVPGLVETEMTERLRASVTPAGFQAITALHPLGIGSPRDVAFGIAFLVADTGRWITGSGLVIDGGYTAQ
jgi:NAD(P)-dependent dehydrogenase (short-subunit alcohol dehydrogenase family)